MRSSHQRMAALITQKQVYQTVSEVSSLPLIKLHFPVRPDQWCTAAAAPYSPSAVNHFPSSSAQKSPQILRAVMAAVELRSMLMDAPWLRHRAAFLL